MGELSHKSQIASFPITFYHTLSKDFTDDIKRVAKSLVALQDQLDSLAEVVLHNKRGLDLLTGEGNGNALK